MEQSEKIGDLCAALVKFQGDVTGAVKGGTNPHLRNAYTRLEDAQAAARAPLAENGLAVIQSPGAVVSAGDGQQVDVTTRLVHSSGEWIQDRCTMPVTPGRGTNPSQQVGIAISYARRYAYIAMLGMSTVDDDGEAPGGRRVEPRKDEQEATPLSKARAALRKVDDAAALENWKTEHGARLPEADKQMLAGDWNACMKRLEIES